MQNRLRVCKMVFEMSSSLLEDVAREQEKKAREEERVAKLKMKKANEKILERRRERLMRRAKTKTKTKNCKSHDSESFTSSHDDEEEEDVKGLTEKAIRESITLTEIEAEDGSKIEAKTEEDHNMFPRSRGRLLRYLRRRSKLDLLDISDHEELERSDQLDRSWISWFCSLPGNHFLCEVDDYFILDDFHLCGLCDQVPYYQDALHLILDEEETGELITEEQIELIESAAEMLYGLIHARYSLTFDGRLPMHNKFNDYEFGRCPRPYCSGQSCLPIGLSDIPRASPVKLYCPKCEDVYDSPQANIDGAYFGTSFAHLFLMIYDCHKPPKASHCYAPRVFGFKLHKPSRENQMEEEEYY